MGYVKVIDRIIKGYVKLVDRIMYGSHKHFLTVRRLERELIHPISFPWPFNFVSMKCYVKVFNQLRSEVVQRKVFTTLLVASEEPSPCSPLWL